MKFSSPREYLEFIQTHLATTDFEDFYGPKSKLEELKEKKEIGSTYEKFTTDELATLKPMEDMLRNLLLKGLDKNELESYGKHFEVGYFFSDDVNAFIFRNQDDHNHAILVNLGLINILQSHFSFLMATERPNEITMFNLGVGDPTNLSSEQYHSLHNTYLNGLLNKRDTPYAYFEFKDFAHIQHTINMLCLNLFLVGHEMGHYFNGDLNDDSAFYASETIESTQIYIDEESHEKEHKADIKGLEVCKMVLSNIGFDIGLERVIESVIEFFGFLSFSGIGSSSSHPDPLLRAEAILNTYLGEQYSGRLRNNIERFYKRG